MARRGLGRLLDGTRRLLRTENRTRPERSTANRLLRLEAVTEAALSHLDLQDLLDELLDRIRHLLDADTAVMLLVEDGDVLIPRAAQGLEEELEADVRIPIGQGFAGRVAAQRTTVVIEDVERAEIVNPILREVGIRSLIGVPLMHRGEVIGVVHAGSYKPDYFSPDDGLLLQLVADRVALAITQSRLYEAERKARRDAELAHGQVSFLASASELLGSSPAVETTLERLAQLAVPTLADEVLLDLVGEDGSIRRIASAHADPVMLERIDELRRRYPPDPDAPFGPAAAIRSGEPQLVPEMTDEALAVISRDREHGALIRALGLSSFMSVPLLSRGRALGSITFIVSTSERRYGSEDLAFAEELARRAAAAIENAQLFAETERRARASLALDYVGEGVFLVDRVGVVTLWNPAAEALTGLRAADVVGREAAATIPGWVSIRERVPVADSADAAALRPETLPLGGGNEIWVLISGVTFPEGTVYAFRDVTEERDLRVLQTEFVATISHELRTPLAAVYGAAMTLQERSDLLDEDAKERLLSVIYDEASRLSRIIDDVLLASRLESGPIDLAIETCEPLSIAESVVRAAKVHLPSTLSVELEAQGDPREMATDPDRVRQVLSNLLDNAVKYSPDGGRIRLTVTPNGRFVRFAVSDEGLGIPTGEHSRIFEKFYRLDPNQTRGVGGTGLGLYISRELVRRMDGRLWVESEEGRGSTFFVELPMSQSTSPVEVLAHIR